MEPRASREELACDRRWLRWRWGNQRAGTASPSRPAVCFACGMALRKGEAPRIPQSTGALQPPHMARLWQGLNFWEPMGGMGLQGCWRVQLSLAPEGHLFLFLRAQNSNTREAGWVSSSNPNQGPCPGDPLLDEGLLPSRHLEAKPLLSCSISGPSPSSGCGVSFCTAFASETPSSAGPPRGQQRFWGIVAGELGTLCPETKPDPSELMVLSQWSRVPTRRCGRTVSPHAGAGPSTRCRLNALGSLFSLQRQQAHTHSDSLQNILSLTPSSRPTWQPGPVDCPS